MARVVQCQARLRHSRGGAGTTLALLLVAAALVGPSSPAAADSGPRQGPPVVIDSAGREVGELVAGRLSSRGGQVAIRVGDVVAVVDLGSHRITHGTAAVAFEATDCTGPPLLIVLNSEIASPPLLRLAGVGPGNILFLGEGPILPATAIGSMFRTGQAVPACGAPFDPAEDVVAASPFLDLNVFTPPFSVR